MPRKKNKQKYNTSFNTSYANYGKENIFNDTKGSISKNKVKFGKNVLMGENVTFGDNCNIGHNTIIEKNVYIGNTDDDEETICQGLENELQEMYLSRKTYAFNADNPGEMNQKRDVFESVMKTADVTFQNLDSSEISLTDVSHYFDSDPTKLIKTLRDDGKEPNSYIADTTTSNAQVRTLGETIRLDSRTKLC